MIIGNEIPLSSDDLSNIDVCMKSSDESVEECPHEKKTSLNISVELVDCLSNDEYDNHNTSSQLNGTQAVPGVKFSPLQPENQKLAAMKFNLIIKLLDTDLHYWVLETIVNLHQI